MIDINLRNDLEQYIKCNYKKRARKSSCLESACVKSPSLSGSINNTKFIIKEITFQKKLFRLIDSKNLNDVDVYKASLIDKKLFSKIRSNVEYRPTKRTVFQFCIGLKLDIDETLDLLLSAGFSLSNSILSDIIFRYFIENRRYDIFEINETLLEHEQKPLISEL